jgi:hypothetical protein
MPVYITCRTNLEDAKGHLHLTPRFQALPLEERLDILMGIADDAQHAYIDALYESRKRNERLFREAHESAQDDAQTDLPFKDQ